jgi:hypothetical protein
VEVLHLHFSGAAAAARGERTGVGLTPREGEELDFVLVRLVLGLALDGVDLQKIIN